MVFQTNWAGTREKEPPNSMRKSPTIALRGNLSQGARGYLNNKKKGRERSAFILQAIETKVFMETSKKRFLEQMLEEHYGFCRHMLRRIGRKRSIQ